MCGRGLEGLLVNRGHISGVLWKITTTNDVWILQVDYLSSKEFLCKTYMKDHLLIRFHIGIIGKEYEIFHAIHIREE